MIKLIKLRLEDALFWIVNWVFGLLKDSITLCPIGKNRA